MYKLKFLGKALDDLKRIDRAQQKIIKAKLMMLAKNPEALKNNIKRIGRAEDHLYRLRTGNYRVIFKKDKDQFVIIIVRIGHRKEIYVKVNMP
ncbi:MAG: type II toxin-antitoxin system RelE/ParE family toxin [Candidatus Aminicenantes bacterium]|nr:type II toxin-antitoxin system RelE/ParE family toxin [Candidatus Aminicenantes bacterium]